MTSEDGVFFSPTQFSGTWQTATYRERCSKSGFWFTQVVVAVSTQSARPSRHVVVALAAQPRLSMIVYLSCYTGAKIVYLSLNLFNPAQYSYRGKENLSENVKRMGSDASKALYSVCHCPFLWDSPKMG